MERKTLGIILDGNRRYAKENNITLEESYKLGAERLYEIVTWAKEYGYTDVIAYTFSKDNWKRDKEEIDKVFSLIRLELENINDEYKEKGIKVLIRGDIEDFPEDIQEICQKVQKDTENNKDIQLWLTLSYTGRDDIVKAAKKCQKDGIDISKENISERLSLFDAPDPECIIRTGGDTRLSGFLSWEAEYSELLFVQPFLPAFSKKDFDECMKLVSKRRDNKGK